jgi:hypothetical protein
VFPDGPEHTFREDVDVLIDNPRVLYSHDTMILIAQKSNAFSLFFSIGIIINLTASRAAARNGTNLESTFDYTIA